MTAQTELTSAKYLTTPLEPETLPAPAQPPAIRTAAGQTVRRIQYFLIIAIVVGLVTTVGRWACTSTSKSTNAADWFLRVAGSEKTWDEYQKDHVKKGHPRLKDKERTWMQQLFNDAYAGKNR